MLAYSFILKKGKKQYKHYIISKQDDRKVIMVIVLHGYLKSNCSDYQVQACKTEQKLQAINVSFNEQMEISSLII